MSDVEFSVAGNVASVRLNRPKALNAVTPEMDQALFDAWEEINANPEIWVAVISAEGERAFCAGADVKVESEGPRIAFGGGITGVGGPLVTVKKPLIASVQGYCLGGGFEMVMCADVIVAADTTQFGMPEIKAGILGEAGIMHRSVRQLPYRIAMTMILTGDRLPAQDALGFGLVNEVVAFEELGDATAGWTEKLLGASPLAQQAGKEAVLSRLAQPLEIALATKYEPIEAYAQTSDVAEGKVAFAERRAPEWSGA
jgi:enoyl-CoA hydratase/carnithine racemase